VTGPDALPERRARVVLLAGPSGCGKTYLALAAGLPILALDDFYRPGSDPDLPRTAAGMVDWEDPRTWDADAACDAVETLCTSGRVEVPNYVFGEDRAVGHRLMVLPADTSLVVAEGIFAAEVIEPLRRRGLLADALLIHDGRWRTFGRRLLRDLREGRKSPWYLVRQGWAKTRSEPEVIAHLRALGARPVSKAEARRIIPNLAKTG
jgi:uridine kinase